MAYEFTGAGAQPQQLVVANANLSRVGWRSGAPRRSMMHIRRVGTFFLAAVLVSGMSSAFASAQDGAKQDMKHAGTETKNAAKYTGHGISKGTQKAYHKTSEGTRTAYDKTKHGTKKAYHKTAKGTKHAADKVEGKPADAPQ